MPRTCGLPFTYLTEFTCDSEAFSDEDHDTLGKLCPTRICAAQQTGHCDIKVLWVWSRKWQPCFILRYFASPQDKPGRAFSDRFGIRIQVVTYIIIYVDTGEADSFSRDIQHSVNTFVYQFHPIWKEVLPWWCLNFKEWQVWWNTSIR